MEKEIELLSRVAIDHLHLAQFEPFRATIHSLRARQPDLALSILQTIVSNGGRFDHVLFSPLSSCPSPALLAWLSTLELLRFHNCTSSVWSFGPHALKLRAEFLLLLHVLISSSDENSANVVDILNRILEIGFRRLKADAILVVVEEEGNGVVDGGEGGSCSLADDELRCLSDLVLRQADVFHALCCNIEKQVGGVDGEDSGMAITTTAATVVEVEVEGKGKLDLEDDVRGMRKVLRMVQRTHLEAMRERVEAGDVDGAISHVRVLNLEYGGVPEAEYRYVYPRAFFS